MTRRTCLFLCLLAACASTLHAARLRVFIDGDLRTAYDASRGKVGRAEWTALVKERKGTILTNDFQGVNIDVPADKETSVGHFSVFFSQTGGYSTQAGNTAPNSAAGQFEMVTSTGSLNPSASPANSAATEAATGTRPNIWPRERGTISPTSIAPAPPSKMATGTKGFIRKRF